MYITSFFNDFNNNNNNLSSFTYIAPKKMDRVIKSNQSLP